MPVAPAAPVPGPMQGGLPFYAAQPASTVKNYTAMEHDKIRGACTLTAADYPVYVPTIFAEILTEGRTTERVQSVLQVRLKPDMNSDHPVSIFVSRDLAMDIKELRFGYGGGKDYESCHRGISPFAVVPVSAESASARRRAQDRMSRVSHLTSSDAQAMETSPGSCPTTYDALQRVLLAYQTFLKIIFGGYCAHYIEVVAIRKTLSRKVDDYSTMAPGDVAGLLWAIFCDARDFFSEPAVGDELPKSNLLATRMWLETGSLKVPFNVPTDRLLGFARPSPSLPGQVQPAGAGTAEQLFGGGAGTPRKSQGQPPWKNPTPNAVLIAAVQPAVTKNPNVRVLDLMLATQPRLRYKEVRVGRPGSCLDVAFMGVCKAPGCDYDHAPQETIPAAKAAKLAIVLKKAATAYVNSA